MDMMGIAFIEYKKRTLIAWLSAAIIISGVIYVYKQKNIGIQEAEIRGPGHYATDSSLKFVAVIFRHGDRAPTFQYTNDPHANAFPEGNGELTKRGKLHMYKKGQIFRRLYNVYLSDLYLNSEISIKTTYMSRTFMSAAMVLAGMYPPISYQKWSDIETVWQPIPIYDDSPDEELENPFFDRAKCPSLRKITDKAHGQLIQNCIEKNITVSSLLAHLSQKCGQTIDKFTLRSFYDLLLCQKAEGLRLPEWIKPKHMQIMRTIFKKDDLKTVYENEGLQALYAGPVLKDIGLTMELHLNNSNHNKTKKMQLYSCHDDNIATSMAFLGNAVELPGFGASLHFHLYYDETVGYNIKMFYHDRWKTEKGEEVSIPICGNPCRVIDFVKLVKNGFSMGWKEKCHAVNI